jgi:CRP/FNR family transcriptional regulator, cyclic AMP receptor protein
MPPPGAVSLVPAVEIEDALNYLSRKPLMEFRRGQVIYNEQHAAEGLYLLNQGRVMITSHASETTEVILDFCGPDHFFGYTGLLFLDRRLERAMAMERSSAMYWSAVEIEEHIQREPRLGLALIQALVQRNNEFLWKISIMATQGTQNRLADLLLRLSERFGVRDDEGAVRLPPFTHQMLSDCIGTSREIVTFQMNKLRRFGYVQYTRKGISFQENVIRDLLSQAAGGDLPRHRGVERGHA